MTIDTSREAVELRLTRLRAAYEEFRAPYGHIAALITQAKLTETMMDALLAERDAALAELDRAKSEIDSLDAECDRRHQQTQDALAEVARLSTTPDDAEVAEMVMDLMHTGEMSMLYRCEIANSLMRLSHALAAETVKREAMEEALEPFADESLHVGPEHTFVAVPVAACDAARATLAKHGSKT